MHIRAEHLHLFPAALTRSERLVETIRELHSDHDLFMRELAGAVRLLRASDASDPSVLAGIRESLVGVQRRLVLHDQIEEEKIYGTIDPADPEAAALTRSVHAEITNLPPRFTAGQIPFDGFILAGGASSRKGSDKANLAFGETTLAGRAFEALNAVAANVYVAGGDAQGFPSVPDVRHQESRASLIGLHSALFRAKSTWVAGLACDLPFVSSDLFRRLITIAENTGDRFEAVVPEQADGRLQPLAAIYRREPCLKAVETMLNENELRLTELLRRLRTYIFEPAMYSDLDSGGRLFFNINTRGDLEAALRQQ